MYGYDAIDDSYNISFTTAQSSMHLAQREAQSQGKKLLVVTAGIPELADRMKHKNRELGEALSHVADHIVVLESMFAQEITCGIHKENQYTLVSNLDSFIDIKSRWSTDEWLLLLLPELTDLYY